MCADVQSKPGLSTSLNLWVTIYISLLIVALPARLSSPSGSSLVNAPVIYYTGRAPIKPLPVCRIPLPPQPLMHNGAIMN
jgi:hypothetical protein